MRRAEKSSGSALREGNRACANSSQTQLAHYLLCVNNSYMVLHSKLVRGGEEFTPEGEEGHPNRIGVDSVRGPLVRLGLTVVYTSGIY